MEKKLLVINGPNLNLLGTREPSVYGNITLDQLQEEMSQHALAYNIKLEFFQSNHEGAIIDQLHQAMDRFDGLIINPGAYTHYSYAIRDAITSVHLPTVEVHISNIHAREEFRHHSVIAPIAIGQITGLGLYGYIAAIHFFANYLKKQGK